MSRLSYTEAQARLAIEASYSWAESLRRLGLCPTGGAWRVLKKHAGLWGIPTEHFLPDGRPPARRRALEDLLVEHSPIRGTKLKERLFRAGLKNRECEMCGQGEEWHGRHMSLILDHINGVRDDNRLENLRIVCANCNATLDTHCGRNAARPPLDPRECRLCGTSFVPRYETQKYCSRACGSRHGVPGPRPAQRRVERPPLPELLEMVRGAGYEEVGRRFGVSGNAIRKWIRSYGMVPPPGRGRDFHPPPEPRRALGDTGARRALELLAAGWSGYAVAKKLGVSQSTIRDLRRGLTYRHLERPPALQVAELRAARLRVAA